MDKLQTIEVKGQRVLTTKQIAEAYGTTRKIISYNFQHNREKYIAGKHYIELSGEELKKFKNCLEFQDSSNMLIHYISGQKREHCSTQRA